MGCREDRYRLNAVAVVAGGACATRSPPLVFSSGAQRGRVLRVCPTAPAPANCITEGRREWTILQQLINGLSLGALVRLIAVGYTVVYGIIQLINFAHGEIFMIGAFGALTAWILIPGESLGIWHAARHARCRHDRCGRHLLAD